jgi:hypothetical protein
VGLFEKCSIYIWTKLRYSFIDPVLTVPQ